MTRPRSDRHSTTGLGRLPYALYAVALANGLGADNGERQARATIRSGLSAGLQDPIALSSKAR